MGALSRRDFVVMAATAAAGLALPAAAQQAGSDAVEIPLTAYPEKPGSTMPENFTGLSYEGAQLADPTFFSASNTGLVGEIRKLGPKGQLRFGGCLSDFTAWWDPAVTPSKPEITPAIAAGQKRFEWIMTTPSVSRAKYAVITPESIRQLRTFCDATGWSVVYGLNLGLGSPERAGAEGGWAIRELGHRLDAFQVGNEADYFMHWKRPNTWNFDDYWREYTAFERAVREHAPQAPFAGPDAAFMPWLQLYAERAGRGAACLSSHYYHMGNAGDPGMNAARLLTPNPKLQLHIEAGRKATAVAGVPYRMTEIGSCSHGGQPGASDAYASALWAAEVMLTTAQGGVCGINMHGGGIEGVYSPIVGDQQLGYTSRPLTYGMRFANHFAGATFVQIDFAGTDANAFAYAARKGSQLLVAVVNKGDKALRCPISGVQRKIKIETATVLTGPAIDSMTGTELRAMKKPDAVMHLPAYSALVYEMAL
jgi:hypothetical protein